MNGWNRDMSAAPRGETKQLRLPEKQGGGYRDFTVKVPVIISAGNDVILSTWNEKRGQWSGLATGQVADAWQPWPEPAKGSTP